jgi:PAS domain S-box-containing protein
MSSALNILLVEDDAHDAGLIQDALKEHGITSHFARVHNQIAFLTALKDKEKPWDLILSAYRLHGFDGLAALSLAHDLKPDLPFIFISGTEGEETAAEAVKKGATDFIVKTKLSRLGPTVRLAMKEREERLQRQHASTTLPTNESQFRNTVESLADWVWEIDSHAVFTYTNPHVKCLLGYEPEQVLGQTPFDFMLPDQAERAKNQFPLFNTHSPSPWSVEHAMVHKDGRLIVIETRGVPVCDHRGVNVGYRGVSRDITLRKNSENEIAHLNRIYALLSEVNKTSVLIRDRAELFREMCRIAVHHGGFRMAWLGLIDFHSCQVRPAAWYGHEDGYLTLLQVTLARTAEDGGLTGAAIRAGKGYICNDIEHDERMRPWREEALKRGYRSAAAFPLRAGEFFIGTYQLYSSESRFFDREVVRLLEGLALDISFVLDALESENWRRQAEAALRESELKYRIVADNTYDWEFWLSPTGPFHYCSPSCRRITGYSAKEFHGDPSLLTRIVHPKDQAHFIQHLKDEQAQCGGRLVFRIVRSDGEERWIEHQCQPILNQNGQFIGSRGSNRDITEGKQLEEQLRQAQKMEIVGHLSGGLAHDFNNVLTVIQGHTGLLLTRPDLDAEVQAELKQVSLAAKRASDLTRQLLTFARRHPLNRESLNLNEVVQGMESMLRRALAEHIALSFEYAPELPSIHADACMLEQVLLNLSLNARDAMPEGGRLLIRTQAVELDESYPKKNPEGRAGSFVCLTLADTGCGIDSLAIPRIFEPFFTTKDAPKSSGLGLSMAYGVVKQHEGWIEVHSQIGKGSQFRIYLPTSPRITTTPASVPVAEGEFNGHETILVVEDEAALRSILRRVLERSGYRVLEACSGADALAVWETQADEIDLVLTDLVMPDGLSGRELVERLRRDRAKLKTLYMSGYCLDVVGQKQPLAEGPHFLAKPFQPADLLHTIRFRLDTPGAD